MLIAGAIDYKKIMQDFIRGLRELGECINEKVQEKMGDWKDDWNDKDDLKDQDGNDTDRMKEVVILHNSRQVCDLWFGAY